MRHWVRGIFLRNEGMGGIPNDLVTGMRWRRVLPLLAAALIASVVLASDTFADDDTTPPTLVSISASAVDLSSGDALVTVDATITDDFAGVDPNALFATFTSPSEAQSVNAPFQQVSGDDYSATLTLPPGSEQGTWSASDIALADLDGNSVDLDAADLDVLGLSATFDVGDIPASADGSGQMDVSPAGAPAGTPTTLSFTYTADPGGLADGAVQLVVPDDWAPPSADDPSADGYVTVTQGDLSIDGQTITVSGLTMVDGDALGITYGDTSGGGAGATSPGSTEEWQTFEKSTDGGDFTELIAGSPTVTDQASVATDGPGSFTVDPPNVPADAPTTLTFTYTADSGGLTDGTVALVVPDDWSTPSLTAGDPGFVAASDGDISVDGQTITVSGLTLADGDTFTITYGGGDGAIPPAGAEAWEALAQATPSDSLDDLSAGPPIVIVTSPDGSGSVSVAPDVVTVNTSGNTLDFTYVADAGGLVGGSVSVNVPLSWPVPSTNPSAAGYSTSSDGDLTVSGRTILVSNLTMDGGASVDIFYGDTSVGPGVTPPAGVTLWKTKEAATAGGVLTLLASSPSVTSVSADGSGTMTVAPTTAPALTPGTTLTFTYKAATGGLIGGSLQLVVPDDWPAPSDDASDPGYVTSSAGDVSVDGQTIEVDGVTLAAAATLTLTYGDTSGGGPGVTPPVSNEQWETLEQSTVEGSFTDIATQPTVQAVDKRPTIASFGPSTGGIGTLVTFTGTRFTGTTAVKFHGTPSTSITVVSGTSLKATVPSGATTGTITVITPNGSVTSSGSFTVIPPSTIASFAPTTGPEGTQVTLTGTRLSGTTAVSFGGTAATAFTVVSNTSVKATVPTGATTGFVSVTTPGGIATSSATFTVLPPPSITSFTPSSGPIGTSVAITGTHFNGTTAVTFNGTPAVTFAVVSDTKVTATVPSGATTGVIGLNTPNGSDTSSSSFTVIPAPTIASFAPTTGPVGTQVTITGTHLTGATAVTFNGAAGTAVTVVSDTSVKATVPSGATTGVLTLTTPGGIATSSTSFTVLPPPSITSFTPSTGPIGTSVAITGTHFNGATGVTFNGKAAVTFAIVSDTKVTATVPSGASTGVIGITTPGGSDTSSSSFTVIPPPAIASFAPSSGLVGTSVTITGTSLGGVAAVTFNGTAASTFAGVSATSVTATVPAGASSGKVAVTTPGGTAMSGSNFVVIPPAPTITSFTPSSGPIGASVTITGTNLGGLTAVTFNGTSVTTTTSRSATSVTATVPLGATTGFISITTAGGTATSSSTFTVVPSPGNLSFTPLFGPIGTLVTINGSNLGGVTAVSFNGKAATTFTGVSATSVTAVVPPGATTGKITLTTPGGTAASSANFTFVATPWIASFTPSGGPVGTSVTFTGANFTHMIGLKFNGTDALTFTVVSDTRLTATVPAGATTGKVTMLNTVGFGTSSGDFTVAPRPTISSFAPTSGGIGSTVTITGTHLTGATLVQFAGGGTSTSPYDVTDGSLKVDVPSGAATGKIQVGTAGGTATSANQFTVFPTPTISSFSPAGGPVGTVVTITGTHLAGTTAVKFNGKAGTSVSATSDTSVTATVPTGATSGTIVLTAPGGTATSSTSFVVILPPTVSGFTPQKGPVGTLVSITGTNLTYVSAVKFAGMAATFTIVSDVLIKATVPAGAKTGAIRVTNAAGSWTTVQNFTVTTSTHGAPPTGGGPLPSGGVTAHRERARLIH
jgi:hypothetical protein